MTDNLETESNINGDSTSANIENTDTQHIASKDKYKLFAFVSLILCIIAWVTLMFEGYTSLVLSALAIITGFIGHKSSRKVYRTLSTATIIASAVLAVVLSAFLIVIYIGLKA